MINVIQQTLDSGDEPGARHVFDVFETLLILVRPSVLCIPHYLSTSSQEIPLLSNHIPQLVQFLLLGGANRNYEPELRILVLNALNWTVQ